MTYTAIYLTHLLTIALTALGLIAAVRRKRLYAALIAGLLIYQALALPALPSIMDEFGLDVVIAGQLAALCGVAMLMVTLESLERALPQNTPGLEPFVENVVLSPVCYLTVVLLLVVGLASITATRGSDLFSLSWEDVRGSELPFTSLGTFLQFIVFPAVWVLWRRRMRLLSFVLLLLSLGFFLVYGSRAALLTIPAVIGLDYYSRGKLNDYRNIAWMGMLLAGLVVVLHVGGRLVRGLGLSAVLMVASGEGVGLDSLSEIDWSGGESNINRYYYFAVQEENVSGVQPLQTLLRWFTMYLPRSVAESFKPMDATYLLWTHALNKGLFDEDLYYAAMLSMVRDGAPGSTHAMIWGEFWINGGAPALIALSVTLGLLLFAIDRLVSRLPSTLCTLAVPAIAVGYVFVARGNSVIGLGYIAYILPMAWLAYSATQLALRAIGARALRER